MQDKTTSPNSGEVLPVTKTRWRPSYSQYDVWMHVDSLHNEADRLRGQPPPATDVLLIARWRRKQIWLIGMRIKELERESRDVRQVA